MKFRRPRSKRSRQDDVCATEPGLSVRFAKFWIQPRYVVVDVRYGACLTRMNESGTAEPRIVMAALDVVVSAYFGYRPFKLE